MMLVPLPPGYSPPKNAYYYGSNSAVSYFNNTHTNTPQSHEPTMVRTLTQNAGRRMSFFPLAMSNGPTIRLLPTKDPPLKELSRLLQDNGRDYSSTIIIILTYLIHFFFIRTIHLQPRGVLPSLICFTSVLSSILHVSVSFIYVIHHHPSPTINLRKRQGCKFNTKFNIKITVSSLLSFLCFVYRPVPSSYPFNLSMFHCVVYGSYHSFHLRYCRYIFSLILAASYPSKS